jgi:hypothetical protein
MPKNVGAALYYKLRQLTKKMNQQPGSFPPPGSSGNVSMAQLKPSDPSPSITCKDYKSSFSFLVGSRRQCRFSKDELPASDLVCEVYPTTKAGPGRCSSHPVSDPTSEEGNPRGPCARGDHPRWISIHGLFVSVSALALALVEKMARRSLTSASRRAIAQRWSSGVANRGLGLPWCVHGRRWLPHRGFFWN